MRKTVRTLSLWLAILIIATACAFSFGGEKEDEETALQTAVAGTVAANQSTAQAGASVPEATITIAPTNTVPGAPTATALPCNRGVYISDTVPDGTKFNVGESFTMTWRMKNTGTCTWNTNYKLVFSSGEKMSGPSSQNLTQTVKPNETVDISVNLKAPNTAGKYKGIWQIADDQGQTFVYNIWVDMEAMAILAPPPVAKADLRITEFSINPATPIMGANTHVRVRANNIGGLDSGGFKMQWYGLTTFANPSCSWNITGGLVAGGSVLMECDFVFSSWYPVDKTSIVYIDTDNQVDESNEGNNSASISPFGVLKP